MKKKTRNNKIKTIFIVSAIEIVQELPRKSFDESLVVYSTGAHTRLKSNIYEIKNTKQNFIFFFGTKEMDRFNLANRRQLHSK